MPQPTKNKKSRCNRVTRSIEVFAKLGDTGMLGGDLRPDYLSKELGLLEEGSNAINNIC